MPNPRHSQSAQSGCKELQKKGPTRPKAILFPGKERDRGKAKKAIIVFGIYRVAKTREFPTKGRSFLNQQSSLPFFNVYPNPRRVSKENSNQLPLRLFPVILKLKKQFP
jgi:hypothetical protein